jgi:preprotein translocase subunit SecF
MELIRPDININFVGMRNKAIFGSLVVILLGMLAIFWRGGLNMGVDFAGGTLIQIQFKKAVTPDEIRSSLKDLIAQSTIQQVGAADDHEFLIRTEAVTTELQSLAKKIEDELSKSYGQGQVSVRRVEMVGPKVGHDLRQKAFFAIFYSLLFIAIYISGRFEFKWATSAIMGGVLIVGVYLLEVVGMNMVFVVSAAFIITLALCWILNLPYALGALLSLVHDILITVAFFALTNKEFTLEVLAAVLTLAGFSINDTIIIFDRIRENRSKDRRQSFPDMINRSINQTLSRTLLTSGTVLLVVLCLFFLGGTVIHDFSFALMIGLIAGSYSTIFIASPLLILYEDLKKGRGRGRGKPRREKSATA